MKRKPVYGKDTIPTARLMSRVNTSTTSGKAHGVLSTPMASWPKQFATTSRDKVVPTAAGSFFAPFTAAMSGSGEK